MADVRKKCDHMPRKLLRSEESGWFLVYTDYDGPTFRVARPVYDTTGKQESWEDQNGTHWAMYDDDKVVPIPDPSTWVVDNGDGMTARIESNLKDKQ